MGRLLRLPLFICLVSSCWKNDAPLEGFRGRTMGTSYSVKYAPAAGVPETVQIKRGVDRLLASIDAEMSTYRADSEISRFNALESAGVWRVVPPRFFAVLEHALEVARLTDGAFDPTLGPLVELWGFGPGGRGRVPDKGEIERVRSFSGYDKIEISKQKRAVSKRHPSVSLDLSASAKGRAVDEVGLALEGFGIRSYMVEIGGEVKVRGGRGDGYWEIGIVDPASAGSSVRRVVRLKDAALATSGDYFNFFEHGGGKYSHVIDRRTGGPEGHALTGVTVVDLGGQCMNADALATALMAMGLQEGREFARRHSIAAYFVVALPEGKFREETTSAFDALVAL